MAPREPQQALLDVVEVYPYIDYIKYLLPGSVALAIFVTAMIGGGMLFIDDKSRGLHEGYMVTPITKWELILGFNLSGVIKAVLAGETVLVIGAVIAGVPNFFEPARLFELTIMVILTSIALIGLMFFIMARISDPLVPRAIFGVLNTLLFFPSGAVYPIAGFPKWLRVMSELRSVYLRGSWVPLAAAQRRRSRRGHHRYFRADVDLGRGAVGRHSAVPADLVAMPRISSRTAAAKVIAVDDPSPHGLWFCNWKIWLEARRLLDEALEPLGLKSREFWLLVIAGAGMFRSMRWPSCAGWTPVRWWPCWMAWSAAACCTGSAIQTTGACNGCSAPKKATVCLRARCRAPKSAEAEQLAVLSAADQRQLVAAMRKLITHFEMTRDTMKPFGIILVLTCLGSGFAQAPRRRAHVLRQCTAATILPASGRNNQGGSVGATRAARPGDHHQRQHPEPQRRDFRTLQRQRAQHHGHSVLRQAVARRRAEARTGLQPGCGRFGTNARAKTARR